MSIIQLPAQSQEPEFELLHRMPARLFRTCGIDCLYVCATVSGRSDLSLPQLEKEALLEPRGIAAATLIETAQAWGIHVEAVQTDLLHLANWRHPAILHVNQNHFIAYLGTKGEKLLLFDNGIGLIDCTPEWFQNNYDWQGTALVFGRLPPQWLALFQWPAVLPLFIGLGILVVAVSLWRQDTVNRRESLKRTPAAEIVGNTK